MVASVETFWDHNLRFAENLGSPGAPIPGVMGRIWVYSEVGKTPTAVAGSVEADVLDITNAGDPVRLACYQIDKQKMKTLMKEDGVGVGYSLFLPLENYTPAVKRVMLRVAFVDEHGNRTKDAPVMLTLRSGENTVLAHHRDDQTVVPALKQK
jgi:hypothetical protein